jgi:hexulose-6-phosphate isomerase
MQGRLLAPSDPTRIQSFPRDSWDAEFARAAEARLDCIEWIYDSHGRDVNPIVTDSGISRMHALQRDTGVAVTSLVADYYMEHLLTANETIERDLEWLIGRCAVAGIRRVVLPFVDASSIRDETGRIEVMRALRRALSTAERHNVEIHLETDLAPLPFAELLRELDHPLVRVNYDSGNSASLGFDVVQEFAAYGRRVGSVHIKDRVRGGTTVPLGQGNAHFEQVFSELATIGYNGDLILQVARGPAGEEVEWAEANRRFVESYVQRFLA